MTPECLKEVRQLLGWSAARAARRLGVSPRQYKYWEARTISTGEPIDRVPRSVAVAMLS